MKNKLILFYAIILWIVLPVRGNAQLLKGRFIDKPADLAIAIAKDGDPALQEYLPISVSEEGMFTFDAKLSVPFVDATIYIGNDNLIGAHLEQGKTLNIEFSADKNGTMCYEFSGDNVKVSEFYTMFAATFDLSRYKPMDNSNPKSYKENLEWLKSDAAKVKEALPTIKDAELRNYYTKLTESSEKYIMVRLWQDEAYETESEMSSNPEYNKIIASADLNSIIDMRSGLSFLSILSKAPLQIQDDLAPWGIKVVDIVSKEITDPVVRRSMARLCASTFFMFNKADNVKKFWEIFSDFAKDYSEIIEEYGPKVEASEKTAAGSPAIDAELMSTDGKIIRLSDLFGKFLYIDIWATWCAPCCAEIPYLEKLVEHFKGDDRIRFVSISIDTKKEAWIAKLKKDNPQWEQYYLTPDVAKKFMNAWGISGIPRFIMIDKDGKIYNADANRPSDNGIAEEINKAIDKR